METLFEQVDAGEQIHWPLRFVTKKRHKPLIRFRFVYVASFHLSYSEEEWQTLLRNTSIAKRL